MSVREQHCWALAHYTSHPIGINLQERRMVEHIYWRELARMHQRFLLLVLVGCTTACSVRATAKPAAQATPPSTCITPVKIPLVMPSGNISYADLNPALCIYSDGLVRRWSAAARVSP